MSSLSQLIELNARADAALREFGAIDLGYRYDNGPCEAYDPKKTQYPSLYINQVSEDVMDIAETGTATIKYKLTGRNMREDGGKKKYGMTLDVLSFEPEAEKKADAKKKAAGEAVKLGARVCVTQFAGGYMNTHDGIQKERGVIGHLKRNAATYATIPLTGVPVVGWGIDRLIRKDGNIRKTSYEPKVNKVGRGRWKVQADGTVTKFSDRSRNGDGQFVGGATGGADPVTMRQAYGEKPKNPLLAPGAAAAALAGAGLLGSKSGRVGVMNAAKKGSRVVRAAVGGLDRKLKGKTGEMWPRMGSKAPKVRRSEGLGEVMVRTAAKGKTRGTRWPVTGD